MKTFSKNQNQVNSRLFNQTQSNWFCFVQQGELASASAKDNGYSDLQPKFVPQVPRARPALQAYDNKEMLLKENISFTPFLYH